ncbi:MAG: Z1 domain-containing protein [Ardenticatenaceae bacterium]|nr:Z1 domain-containing protein [Ardenticatenaceae bacterium]
MNDFEPFDPLVKMIVNDRRPPQDVKKDLLAAGLDPAKVEKAYQDFLRLTGKQKFLGPPPMLVENKQKEGWYLGADAFQDAKFWPSLRTHLLDDKRWPEEAVESIHHASDKIVSWLEHPLASRINTRGLVVGYVQSGKTANFTAVIAKAADAGYRFFIVLSGTKKALRQQTQQRLYRELILLNDDEWFSPTLLNDFRPNSLGNPNYFLSDKKHDKILCVVKKNSTILRKLITWLSSADRNILQHCPFLIIDDEADEASINTARNQANTDPENRDRSAINRHLVSLLRLLPKAAYIGYTATPFANVLIDPSYPNDLYPGDFIVSLPKPENHFGTEGIFGRARLLEDDTDEEFVGLDVVRIVPDDEVPFLRPKRYEHDFVPDLTPSLKYALRYYWLACAARFARGQQNEHSSMLIHTTQLIRVHNSTRDSVDGYRQTILRELKGPRRSQVLQEFAAIWDEEQTAVPPEEMGTDVVTFDELRPYLNEVINETMIVADNYQSTHRLSYEGEAKIQIVIGGNTLSRGLTLEGLIVSFFVRSARAYDTLLQMGRWFGYRPGYADLPRIWMTSELSSNFFDLATIEAEIRHDIANYEKLNVTPREFGVKIRSHPDLNITAPLKMQYAVQAQVSYDDNHVQTVLFEEKNAKWLNQNIKAAGQLVNQLSASGWEGGPHNGHILFRDVPKDYIISFFRSYNFHDNNRSLSADLLINYIDDQNKYGLLKNWNVVIRGVTARSKAPRGSLKLGAYEVPLLERAKRKSSPENNAHIGVLMSRGDTGADLPQERKELKNLSEDDLKTKRNVDLPFGTGLLILYPIDKDSEPGSGAKTKEKLDAAAHVIGLGIVFPKAAQQSRGEQSYVTVDQSLLDRSDFIVEEEEEDEDA